MQTGIATVHERVQLVPVKTAPEQGVVVATSAYPFSTATKFYAIEEGHTVADIIEALTYSGPLDGLIIHVWIHGQYIPKSYWSRIRPKSGAEVTVKIIPGKGGGKKNPLAMILSIAVIAASFYVSGAVLAATGSQILAGVASAAVSAVGNLLVSAIAPPPSQRLTPPSVASNPQESPTLFIEGARNTPNLYGVVPVILGQHRIVPPLGANTYTETSGGLQYARQNFCWGMGKYDLGDSLKIGETPLSEYQEVDIEHFLNGEGSAAESTLYPGSVFQEDLSIQLTIEADWQQRTTQPGADQVIFDITCPRGLVSYNTEGKKLETTVVFEWQYGVAGSGIWGSINTVTLKQAQTAAVRKQYLVDTGGGQYDFRFRRTTPMPTSDKVFNEIWLTSIKTFTNENPINIEGASFSNMRIRATDQLNGAVDQFNGVPFLIAPDWDTDTQTWIERTTKNPGSLFLWVAQNSDLFYDEEGNPSIDSPNARPLGDDRIHLDDIQDFAEWCTEEGLTYNGVIDFETSVWEVLKEVASAGQARPTLVDGKWSVIIDREQTLVAQQFTEVNVWGYQCTKIFPEIPHALRIQFTNEEIGYLQDEMMVYDDGYDENNARKIAGLQLPGITEPALVFRHGRRYLATMRLRPNEHAFFCDVEHLACSPGRLIKFQHSVPLIGVASGYVRDITLDEGDPANVVSVRLDKPVPMVAGKTYSLRFRKKASITFLYKSVVTVPGDQQTLTFTAPFPDSEGLEIDDLFTFGETGRETIELIVRDIIPDNDLIAKLVCVDASPGIHEAHLGTMPPFVSQISPPASFARPLAPVVKQIQTGAEVQQYNPDGSASSRMVITLENRNAFDVIPSVKIKPTNSNIYEPADVVRASAEQIVIEGLIEQTRYDLQLLYKKVLTEGMVGISGSAYSPITPLNNQLFEGFSDDPPDVTGIGIQILGETAILFWDTVVLTDFSHFEVRYSPNASGVNWASAQKIKDVYTNEAIVAAGTGTYLVKCVDRGGNTSDNAAVTSVVVYAEGRNAIELIEENPSYAGTHDNTVATGLGLELDNLLLGTGTYLFDHEGIGYLDLEEVFSCKLKLHMVAQGRNVGNTMDLWGSLAALDSLAGSSPSSWTATVQVRYTLDDPAGTPTWSEWQGLQASEVSLRAVQGRIILTGNGSNITPVVSELAIIVDMPDRIEREDNVTIPDTGLTITYPEAFRAKPTMIWALIDGEESDVVTITSEDETGFTIAVTNASAGVERHFNYHSIGYGRVLA